jgi:hypothetical protein
LLDQPTTVLAEDAWALKQGTSSIQAQESEELVGLRPTLQAADSLADARLATSQKSGSRDLWDAALLAALD